MQSWQVCNKDLLLNMKNIGGDLQVVVKVSLLFACPPLYTHVDVLKAIVYQLNFDKNSVHELVSYDHINMFLCKV